MYIVENIKTWASSYVNISHTHNPARKGEQAWFSVQVSHSTERAVLTFKVRTGDYFVLFTNSEFYAQF